MNEEERKDREPEDKLKNCESEDEEDSEDDDYVPSDNDEKDESTDEVNLDGEDLVETNETNSISKQLNDEEKKRRADELWAELCSSTSVKSAKCSKTKSQIDTTNTLTESSLPTGSSKPEKIKLIKEYDFAGEMIKVEEEVERKIEQNNVEVQSTKSTNGALKRGAGLNNLVANLGKKQKMSTLGKTKLDWDLFKKEEGLEDDLKNHVKNKNSYVEKQAFLQRTDLKQFELEKTVREKNRFIKN